MTQVWIANARGAVDEKRDDARLAARRRAVCRSFERKICVSLENLLAKCLDQGFEKLSLSRTETCKLWGVHVHDADQLRSQKKGHDNFRSRSGIANDVSRELIDVIDDLSFTGLGRGPADALAEWDLRAGRSSRERT